MEINRKQRIFSILTILIMVVILTCIFVACDTIGAQDSSFRVIIHTNNGQPNIVWDIATDIPSVTKDGFLFIGYFYDENFTKSVSVESLRESNLTNDIDIYVKWAKCSEGLQYTLNDDANGYTLTGIGSCIDTNIVIPSNYKSLPVTCISDKAFYNRITIVSVIIPDSITKIGDYAFMGCYGLTVVTIGVNVEYLGRNVFRSCSGLTTVNWNAKACKDNKALQYYPIFDGDENLNTINIGENVVYIPSYMFYSCVGLTGVYITNIKKWCEINFGNEYANPLHCAHKLYLNDELITNLIIPNGATKLSEYLFTGFSELVNVVIPDSVQLIGGKFEGCEKLQSINVSNNNTRYASVDGILYDKAKIEIIYVPQAIQGVISIPNTVMKIKYDSFSNRIGLTDITIGNGVISIEFSAFSNCTNLTNVIMGYNVKLIESGAFENCTNLRSVVFVDTTNWYVSSNSSGTKEQMNVNDAQTNASNFVSQYCYSHWEKIDDNEIGT